MLLDISLKFAGEAQARILSELAVHDDVAADLKDAGGRNSCHLNSELAFGLRFSRRGMLRVCVCVHGCACVA